MLQDLTPEQRRLADAMSDLSEQAYSAGWMTGLEYALWAALIGQADTHRLRLELSTDERASLRALSDACGGWIVFDETTEETWIPLAEWEQRFAERRRG